MYTKDLVAVLTTTDGKTYTLDKTKLLSRTFTENSSSASNISLGYCAAKSYTFALNNLNGQWDDVILTDATMLLSVEDTADVTGGYKIGKFYIETAKKENGAINITSTDAMTKFDTKFMGATYPCTIGHLVQVIADQLNIKLATPTFTNSEFTIEKGDRLKGASCRNILVSCCELAGCFAQITSDEELELRWYDFSTMVTEFAYGDFSKFVADETPTQITGVQYYLEDKKLTAGSDGNAISITANNALFDNVNESDIQNVLDSIYNDKIKQLGYLPCNFTTSDFRGLKIGDAVWVTTEKGQRYVSIVTQNKIIGMMQNQVLCVGKSIIVNKGYTKAIKGVNDADKGDKIGYVLGESNRAYAFTNSTQTVAACALGLDVDTRVAVQLLATYQFSPDEETNAPLITLEYRVNGATQMTFYQYPHSGMNTFSAAFIPSAQKPGTASIDLRLTVLGGGVALEKRQAQISLLVKNGNVVDTPPWPEINISQSFNAITVSNNSEMIRVVALGENVMVDTAEPQAGAISQDFTAINILHEGLVSVTAMFDNLSLARVIKGEILKFNKAFKARYIYTEKYMMVGTDFKEEQAYLFDGVEGVIDSGKLFEIPISTTEFKAINGLEVI